MLIETVSKSHGSIEFKNLIGVSEKKYLEEYESKYRKRNSTNARGGENPNNSLRDETAPTSSIPDSGEKSNPSEENSSQEVGEAQFSLAKSEDGKRIRTLR